MPKTMTPWKEWTEDSQVYRTRVEFGFDEEFAEKHNQAPYFSITTETQRREGRRFVEDSFGRGNLDRFPELQPLLKWHLCAVGTGPMHYVENGLYWWGKGATGGWNARERSYDPLPLDAFKSTVVYGALPEDAEFDPQGPCLAQHEVRVWLKARLPRLLAAMDAEMVAHHVEVPSCAT